MSQTSATARLASFAWPAETAEQQAEEKYEASLAGYKRAFSACVTGRGYTVN